MTPYALTKLTKDNADLFRKVEFLVRNMPDVNLGTYEKKPLLLSCHILARAVGRMLKLDVVDGEYIVGFSHSWLLTPDKLWVIDVYPCGAVGGPLIVDASASYLPGQILYKKGKVKAKAMPFSSPEFKAAVSKTLKALQGVVAKERIKQMMFGAPTS